MYLQTVVLAACLLAQSAEQGAQDVASCLSEFEQGTRILSDVDNDPCLKLIRSASMVGGEQLWISLRRIIKSDQVSIPIRAQLLIIAAQKADDRIALELVSILRGYASELDTHGPLHSISRGKNLELYAKSVLLRGAIHHSVQHIEDALHDQKPLLGLLEQLARTKVLPGLPGAAKRAISDNPAPLEVRRDCAMRLIAQAPKDLTIDESLLRLLDASVFHQLRAMVRESSDPDTFHFGAAGALAHFGDQEILDDLEDRRAPFRQRHLNNERALDILTWKIKIQNPPEELANYIASNDEDEYLVVDSRLWAIKRAVELQVPKEKIRTAVLKFAERFRLKNGTLAGLGVFKKQAEALGVLKPGDLSQVPTLPRPEN